MSQYFSHGRNYNYFDDGDENLHNKEDILSGI